MCLTYFYQSQRESPPRTKEQAGALESMDIASPPTTPHPTHKAISPASDESSNHGGVSMASTTRAVSPVEDYVIVPENLPSDHSAGSTETAPKPPTSVDLNAIFRFDKAYIYRISFHSCYLSFLC